MATLLIPDGLGGYIEIEAIQGASAYEAALASGVYTDTEANFNLAMGNLASHLSDANKHLTSTEKSQLHVQGTDQGLDTGGPNAVTASQAKIAYTHSQLTHAPSDAVSLTTVKADSQVSQAIANSHAAHSDDETQATIKAKLGAATNGVDGFLTAVDHTTFSGKQDALGFTPEQAGVALGLINNLKNGVGTEGDTLLKLYNLIVAGYSEVTVTDINARNAYNITKLPTNVFVTDDGDTRWALYKAISTGTNATFIKISDPDLLGGVMSGSQIAASYEGYSDVVRFTTTLKAKLDSFTAVFTTGKESAYQGAVDWITTNGATLIANSHAAGSDKETAASIASIILGVANVAAIQDNDQIPYYKGFGDVLRKFNPLQLVTYLTNKFDLVYFKKADELIVSAGPVTQPTWSNTGYGQVTVSDFTVNLFSTTNNTGICKQYTVTETQFDCPLGSPGYLVAYYNGGFPVMGIDNSFGAINNSNYILIGIFLWNNYMGQDNYEYVSAGTYGEGLQNKLANQLFNIPTVFQYQSGLGITIDAAGHVTLGFGTIQFYGRTINIGTSTSISGKMWVIGGYNGNTEMSTASQIYNSMYQDTLDTYEVSAGNYAKVWFYVRIDNGGIYAFYGNAEYTYEQAINTSNAPNIYGIDKTSILVASAISLSGSTSWEITSHVVGGIDFEKSQTAKKTFNDITTLNGGISGSKTVQDALEIIDNELRTMKSLTIDGGTFPIVNGKTPIFFLEQGVDLTGGYIRADNADTFTVDFLYSATPNGTPVSITTGGTKPTLTAQTYNTINKTGWTTTSLVRNGACQLEVAGGPTAATYVTIKFTVQ